MSDYENYKKLFQQLTNFKENPYHPFVWILGEPIIGDNVYIGGFSEINSQGAKITIGNHCDIASFVSINCADSHLKCIGLSKSIVRKDIILEDHIFIGSHSVIKGSSRGPPLCNSGRNSCQCWLCTTILIGRWKSDGN